MSAQSSFLAIDLGAESGRAVLGRLADGLLRTEEVHRFPNEPVRLAGTLYWDLPRLQIEIVRGIEKAARASGGRLDGIAVDTWGVDFGLLDDAGNLVGLPVHYRDERTRGMLGELFSSVPREEIFSITGLQFLELNTLVQLATLARRQEGLLAASARVLLMADLFAYFLCGRAAAEVTLASTSQLLDARSRQWSDRLIEAIGLRRELFGDIVEAGTPLAPLHEEIARQAGLETPPPVIASASHDTAAAVAAVPAVEPGDWGYLSSGTWSLIGVELESPCLEPEALDHNFTNEAGAFGTTRFLRNINGLWLVQECRRQWASEGEDLDYGRLAELAAAAPPGRAWIDPTDPEFFSAGDMPRRIRESCRKRGLPVPETKGEVIRCALESLARAYGERVREIEAITARKLERLHVVGGGSQHRLLNQLTADQLAIPVIAGPTEATAIGNLLMQARATGAIEDLEELRRIVAASAEIQAFDPRR